MPLITRRTFIAASTSGAGTLVISSAARAKPANEKVMLALIGCGGRGVSVALDFASRKDAEVACLCDLHEGRLAKAVKAIANRQAKEPTAVKEMRRVFDDKAIDAVIIATPDHWHAPASILACQSGKDVYVEKPPSHNLWEGRKMVEAARKYDRIVQVGTQNRSSPYNLAAREYIKSGKLGDIHLVKVFNLKSGSPFHLGANDNPPTGFDWQAWLGPAPSRPHNSRLFQGGWHQFWAYSGGDLADDGIHQIDLAMMLLGDPDLPRVVHGSAGRFAHRDDGEVPDTQVITYELPKLLLTFELTGWPPYMDKIAGDVRTGSEYPFWPQCATRIEIYGSKGLLYIGPHGGGWQVFERAKRQSRPGEIIAQMHGRPGDAPHEQDFIDCIKSRKRPNADIEIGHQSISLVHLGNIAHRCGNQRLVFDAKSETFVESAVANKLLRRHNQTKYSVADEV
jgi:predicted dehydrogenase